MLHAPTPRERMQYEGLTAHDLIDHAGPLTIICCRADHSVAVIDRPNGPGEMVSKNCSSWMAAQDAATLLAMAMRKYLEG